MHIMHLFVSYAHINLCHFFSSSWCRGLAEASACGSSWTFLFTFLNIEMWQFYLLNVDWLLEICICLVNIHVHYGETIASLHV